MNPAGSGLDNPAPTLLRLGRITRHSRADHALRCRPAGKLRILNGASHPSVSAAWRRDRAGLIERRGLASRRFGRFLFWDRPPPLEEHQNTLSPGKARGARAYSNNLVE